MLNLEGENAKFKPYVTDYEMNLITLEDLKEENCETGLRELLGFLKCRQSKEKMKEYCSQNEDRIRNMDEEGGKVDMCKAMQDWAEELREEGTSKGIKALIEVCRELEVTREETFVKVKDKFVLSQAEAESYMDKYWT
ncbi:MAG: hypothetical protein J6C64_04095 [Lachnospiraceae bacterium]|nr:hypothetical protein [Lachnospiraceae bacterium]